MSTGKSPAAGCSSPTTSWCGGLSRWNSATTRPATGRCCPPSWARVAKPSARTTPPQSAAGPVASWPPTAKRLDAVAPLFLLRSQGRVLNNAAKNIQGVLVNAAGAAIASAPGLILQRGSVGLYELYQQLMAYANGSVTLASKSCEQMQSDRARGENPYRP